MCRAACEEGWLLPAPRFWHCFAGYFGLDDAAMRRWWEALCSSRCPLAVTWRQAIQLCDEIGDPEPGSRARLLAA
jgi:hypothetical protein